MKQINLPRLLEKTGSKVLPFFNRGRNLLFVMIAAFLALSAVVLPLGDLIGTLKTGEPIFTDYTLSHGRDLLFDAVVIFYWLAIIAVIFTFIQRRKTIRPGIVLFTAVFFYLAFWIPQGFDVTDEGFVVTKSWFMFEGKWKDAVNMFWFSTFLNGIWLRIAGRPFLLWERVGYALLHACMALISFKILSFYRKGWRNIFLVFSAVLVSTSSSAQTVNYKNVPVLLMLLSILFLHISIKNKRRILYTVISGAFLGVSIHARIPYLWIAALPPVFYSLYARRKEEYPARKMVLLYYGGVLAGLVAGLGVLASAGSLGPFMVGIYDKLFRGFFVASGDTTIGHSGGKILLKYLENAKELFVYTMVGVGLTVAGITVGGKLKRSVSYTLFMLLCFLGVMYFLFFGVPLYNFVLPLIFSIFIVLLLFCRERRSYFPAVFWSLVLMIASFLGSGNGVKEILNTGGIYLALPLFLLIPLKLKNVQIRRHARYFVIIVTAVICIFGVYHKYSSVYRERERPKLTAQFQSPGLFGIWSSPERVEVVDGILEEMNRELEARDVPILVVNSAPMLYYLADRPYYLNNPWILLKEKQEIKRQMLLRMEEEGPPAYIVLAKRNPRKPDWPLNESVYSKGSKYGYRYLTQFAGDYYTALYENDFFIFYRHRDLK